MESGIVASVLFVDDEPQVLAAIERSLFQRYELYTATSGIAGLKCLIDHPDIRVVVSDMRMPVLDGAQFLQEVRRRHEGVVTLLLTGHADLEQAAAAVNEGAIFKLLTKPCPQSTLFGALDDALALVQARDAESALLHTTLLETMRAMSQMLALASPAAYLKTRFVEQCVRYGLPRLQWSDRWQYEAAATLSQIGRAGGDSEPSIVDGSAMPAHSERAWALLRSIPRLDKVALMVRYHDSAIPVELDETSRQGAQLLHAAVVLEGLTYSELGHNRAQQALIAARHKIAPRIIDAVHDFVPDIHGVRLEAIHKLVPGWLLEQDVLTDAGMLVLHKGQRLSEAAITALNNLLKLGKIADGVRVQPL